MTEPPTKKVKVKSDSEKKEQIAKLERDLISKIADQRQIIANNVSGFKFNKTRVRVLSEAQEFPDNCGGILYWMSRDQRVQDNWAFLYAQKLALKMKVPLHVCFSLVPKFLDASYRQFSFMLEGLREVEQECRDLDIPFHLLYGLAKDNIPKFTKDHNIGGVVTDFSPLRVPLSWMENVKKELPKEIPFCQVDAHNIVPCWEASPKLEYGARTIRKKIHDQLPSYFTEFPPVVKHPHKPKSKPEPTDWEAAHASLECDRSVCEVDWAEPGTVAGLKMLESFIKERLKYFGGNRNDPTKPVLSNMSPWYHFDIKANDKFSKETQIKGMMSHLGQVSVQRAMIQVRQYRSKYKEGVEAYIEEGIIRRELADNFCFYNKDYDRFEGGYDWAKKSLNAHRKDKREYLYTREQLEHSKTHDPLWNAAQLQMVREGKMHGFLRMYWAKKILEWTESPEKALADAIYLNDKYELDGRDPNGYVGCMWSIIGIHDQGWAERPVFGKIRYMNFAGCKRRFNVDVFCRKYRPFSS